MDSSASEKCLERLGITLDELIHEPGFFLNRVHPTDKAKFHRRIRDCELDTNLTVTLYDDNNRARRDVVSLGTFLEFVDEETTSLRVGLVVGCLKSRITTGTQSLDLLLLIELPGENSETAKMPPPNALARIAPTSAITCKIDVEQRSSNAPPPPQQQSYAAPPPPSSYPPSQVQQQQPPPLSNLLEKMSERNEAFILAINSSFYALDVEGTTPLGSYLSPLLSVARSLKGQMYATTETGKLLCVEFELGRVRELGSTRMVADKASTEFAAAAPIQIRGLCFAEGKPATMSSSTSMKGIPSQLGVAQLYGIAKDVPNRNGDCLVMVQVTGRCDLVFELGRKDVVALACVPIPLGLETRNPWYGVGPSDADQRAMRFILWTERGGLFVVDETRRSLQQLCGDLVQSLGVTAVAFDAYGELFAAGIHSLYSISPAGRMVEVAPLSHLPGRTSGLCFAPRSVIHPPELPESEEVQEEDVPTPEEQQPRQPRSSKSWWKLTKDGGESFLRLFKPKSSSSSTATTAAKAPTPTKDAPKPPPVSSHNYATTSFNGRRMSNPLLPQEGMSKAETAGNRKGSGGFLPQDQQPQHFDQPAPPQQQQPVAAVKRPYFPPPTPAEAGIYVEDRMRPVSRQQQPPSEQTQTQKIGLRLLVDPWICLSSLNPLQKNLFRLVDGFSTVS